MINRSLLFFLFIFKVVKKRRLNVDHITNLFYFSHKYETGKFIVLHITGSKHYILQIQNLIYYRVKTLQITAESKHYILKIQNITYYRFKTLHITDSKPYIL